MEHQNNKLILDLCTEVERLTKECQKLRQELNYCQHYDLIAGIYNRETFYKETKKMLFEHINLCFVMLRMDIARFKLINELLGREGGDSLLQYIGQKLKHHLKEQPNVTYARCEADIFYICFPYSAKSVFDMIALIEKILSAYKMTFEIVPYFGIYIIEDPYMPMHLICDRTNLAVRPVKGNYIKRWAYYEEELHNALLWEQEITNQMSTALIEQQFEIYLQPQCNLLTGKPVGAEALVRWNHPKWGMIPPDKFIPVFEKNGFIMRMDVYVWEKTCMQIRKWLDAKRSVHPISVNVSRVNLYNSKICDILIEMVKKYNIPPRLLELEITESAYSENQKQLSDVMKRLQKYGFTVLMDDFGSGYSSLNTLKDLIVDILKLDLAFLSGEDHTKRGSSILTSIVTMAKWIELRVIAEGVENKEQVEFLKSIDCIIAQGYYFAKPMPIPEYEKHWLA